MLGNRRRDTTPEIALRRRLHAAGLRFRVDYPLPFDRRRRADIVFTKVKLAVFVDGCFWHSCPSHGTIPTRNADYWLPKLTRNRARDTETNRRLLDDGWAVLRFWEHEDPDEAAGRIAAEVARLRSEPFGSTRGH
jgi:DNA mismatch endonuclease (patch repair protein)